MNTEQQKIEYKSLQKIRTGEKGFKELSTTCVALANAQGGQIMIDVEDKTKKPAPNQVIPQEEANSAVTRLRGLCFYVGLTKCDACADETGRIANIEIKEIRKIVYSIVGTEIANKGLTFSGARIFTPTFTPTKQYQPSAFTDQLQIDYFRKIIPKGTRTGEKGITHFIYRNS